nr:syndecan-4 [Misgurnus anguillicaudatus]
MLKVYLTLVLLAAAVFAESVRETETWVPLKNKSPREDLESSGDSPNGDFEFTNITPTTDDEDGFFDLSDNDDDDDDDDEISGSGDVEITEDVNLIPDSDMPVPPKPPIDDEVLVKNNEVLLRAPSQDIYPNDNNVLMSHADDDSIFRNKEVLAAVIAGGAVGLIFAVVLIVLLVHFVLRIKKKDEGSYELSKTPIYKKAPTAEIYA